MLSIYYITSLLNSAELRICLFVCLEKSNHDHWRSFETSSIVILWTNNCVWNTWPVKRCQTWSLLIFQFIYQFETKVSVSSALFFFRFGCELICSPVFYWRKCCGALLCLCVKSNYSFVFHLKKLIGFRDDFVLYQKFRKKTIAGFQRSSEHSKKVL